LAEALRVQMYWAVAALPIVASDNYLRKQAGALGWIQIALRGPALWATSLALEIKVPNRPAIGEGWILDQLKFFGGVPGYVGKSEQNKNAARRNKLISR
jgi:hypothetical protein